MCIESRDAVAKIVWQRAKDIDVGLRGVPMPLGPDGHLHAEDLLLDRNLRDVIARGVHLDNDDALVERSSERPTGVGIVPRDVLQALQRSQGRLCGGRRAVRRGGRCIDDRGCAAADKAAKRGASNARDEEASASYPHPQERGVLLWLLRLRLLVVHVILLCVAYRHAMLATNA